MPNPKRIVRPDEYASLAAERVRSKFHNGETVRIDGAGGFILGTPTKGLANRPTLYSSWQLECQCRRRLQEECEA